MGFHIQQTKHIIHHEPHITIAKKFPNNYKDETTFGFKVNHVEDVQGPTLWVKIVCLFGDVHLGMLRVDHSFPLILSELCVPSSISSDDLEQTWNKKKQQT